MRAQEALALTSRVRIAYRVTVRRMANGCDYTGTIFAHDPMHAIERFKARVRLIYGVRPEELRGVSIEHA